MARSLVWYRSYLTSTGFTSDDQITDVLPAPGSSTLVRLHYQFIAQQRGAISFDNLPYRTPVLGVIARDSSDLALVPNPIDFPDNDWLHYEALSFQMFYQPIPSPSFVLTTFPNGDARRDIKAQRKFPDGIQLTWVWKSIGVGAASVFVQLAYQALVEWPEGLHPGP